MNRTRETHLPSHKAHSFDDGRLHDLLAWKYAPRDRGWALARTVRLEIALLVNRVVCDVRVAVNTLNEGLQLLRMNEELEVGL